MKKLILAFGLCAVLSSCEEPLQIGDEYVTLSIKSYVVAYVDRPILKGESSINLDKSLSLTMYLSCEDRTRDLYYASEFGLNLNSEKFLEVAARNGDMGYTESRMWPKGLYWPGASAENYRSIDVVCVDGAWDEAHPAGSSLNDLTLMYFETYEQFVKNGYDYHKADPSQRKLLTELSETDLYMFNTTFSLYIKNCPKSGRPAIRITLTTVDGVERTTAL